MLVELKLKADEKLSFTAWRERWKPRIEQNFVKEKFSPLFFSYSIWRSEKRGELLLSLLCTMSAVEGWLLCMLFYRTHNQYYFNYTVEFFIIDKSFFFPFRFVFFFHNFFFCGFSSLFFFCRQTKSICWFRFGIHFVKTAALIEISSNNTTHLVEWNDCVHAAWKCFSLLHVVKLLLLPSATTSNPHKSIWRRV